MEDFGNGEGDTYAAGACAVDGSNGGSARGTEIQPSASDRLDSLSGADQGGRCIRGAALYLVSFDQDTVEVWNMSSQLLLQLFQTSEGLWSEGLDGCDETAHVHL
jgi:hypothetical protein